MNALPENTLRSLRCPPVRDLAWACFGAPLLHSDAMACAAQVSNCALTLTPQRADWLRRLDRQPQTLVQHLAGRGSSRLGLYFESLWHFFLEQDSDVELLAHNLPVREAGRTLGEFDCIYFCRQRGRAVHLELALKYYLHHPATGTSGEGLQHWLGPNARDRLDLKVRRLFTHQILLSHTPAGAAALRAIGVTQPRLEVELRGRLFHHVGARPALPRGYNETLPLQRWCKASEYPDCVGRVTAVALRREQWLAPLLPSATGVTDDSPAPALRPRQVALLDDEGLEQSRLFIVPETWPGC